MTNPLLKIPSKFKYKDGLVLCCIIISLFEFSSFLVFFRMRVYTYILLEVWVKGRERRG